MFVKIFIDSSVREMKKIYVLIEKRKTREECDKVIVGIEADSQEKAAVLLGGELAQSGVEPSICFFRKRLKESKKWEEKVKDRLIIFQRTDCKLEICFHESQMIKIPNNLTLKTLRIITEE